MFDQNNVPQTVAEAWPFVELLTAAPYYANFSLEQHVHWNDWQWQAGFFLYCQARRDTMGSYRRANTPGEAIWLAARDAYGAATAEMCGSAWEAEVP